MDLQFSSLLLFTLLILLLFWVLKLGQGSKQNRSNRNLPPGPWKLPIIGSMHHMVGALPHHALRNLARKHGPIMHLQLGEVTTIVISSPELAKEVLKTHDINFAYRPEFRALKILTYDCTNIALAPYGEYWRQLRKICSMELLSANKVQSFRWIREEEASNLIQCIAPKVGSPINLTKHLFSTTFSIIGRAAFGKKCSAQDRFKEVIQATIVLGQGFDIADTFPSRTFLHSIGGTKTKLKSLHQESDSILESIISEHREARGKMIQKGEANEDLVDVLLKYEKRGDQGFSLTTNNMKAVIFDLFGAGGETTTTIIEWAMAELIKNPNVLEKAQAEVRQVFNPQGEVREDGLTELKYLKLVIKEVLRFHPAVVMLLPRETRERCEIGGFEIPNKARVIINAWAIGRDPKYWSKPETFQPERFLDTPFDYIGTNLEYIPFGAGRRICPGSNFALAVVEYLLAMLLYHFDWKLPNGLQNEDLDMTESFGITVKRKHDLSLIPTPYRA